MSQGGEQGGDREDNVNMPMAMLVQLQKEFEMLKKNNEEELSMLRAENAHMRRKLQEETVVNSSFETVQPGIQVNERIYNENSQTRRRWLENSGVCAGISSRKHPFYDVIVDTPLPDNWKNLTIDKYDGSTDPDEHIAIYTTQISLYTWNDAVMCRVFPTTLKGAALSWFTRLPPLSINCFDTLIEKFGAQFATSRPHHLTSIALVNIRQEKGESLRMFMERFGKVALGIRNLSPEVTMHHMITTLKPGPFADSLCKKPAINLDELRQRASKFMQMEELREFRNQVRVDGGEKRVTEKEHPPVARRAREEFRSRKFQQYTPLNANRARVLQEAMATEIIPPLRKARTPERADHTKHCEYHKNHGHHTEECIGLKDRIEELIQAGQLKRFVQGGNVRIRLSPERGSKGGEMGQRRVERFERRDEKRVEKRSDRRDGRLERRSDRDHQNTQSVRRSRERSLGRPVRGFINTISGGFSGKESSSARKQHWRSIRTINHIFKRRTLPPMLFTDEDFQEIDPDHDDPMVITVEIAEYAVMKTLVDQGSSVDILFWDTFKRLHLREEDIVPFRDQIIGFSGERVNTKGYIDLMTTFGRGNKTKKIKIRYLVVDATTSYNVLLGRSSLNKLGAIVSTPHLAMKFPTEKCEITTVYVNQKDARECYAAGLKMNLRANHDTERMVAMADLDPRINDERIEPKEETTVVVLGQDEKQCTYVSGSLPKELLSKFITVLRNNKDLFAWKPSDIPGIDPKVVCHKLSVCQEARPVSQKRRKLGEERRKAAIEETEKLMQAGFIKEAQYTTWLSNVVLVKKPNGKWRMCTDYTDLNKACPKDTYPLPNIDRLVDGASGQEMMSFLDAYSGYNQIQMYEPDVPKTAFTTDTANYCYKVMPFGLKNAGATYQRLMDKVFKDQIGKNMEVYVDDMVVKSGEIEKHLEDLEEVFAQIRKYEIRLNPEKCVFGVRGGKFIGFMLTNRGIEANPDKCEAIMKMGSPKNLKEVQRLVGKLNSLSRFLPILAEKTKPIVNLLKKSETFEWDERCEQAFSQIKTIVAEPPILVKPVSTQPIIVYLATSAEAIGAALIQETPEQKPIYFVSSSLQSAETRYPKIEKVALTLVYTARRLRPYFQNHQIIVRTDYPISKILRKPELAGRMVTWTMELSEYGIKYEPRGPIKAQSLADFIIQMPTETQQEHWTLYVD
ncbi:uncharacterized protein [Phaseolus vulgaris]|uniref:uncharacterized protein n=1 Tax=Phaseolus vulgaris TaxID=3885 RepID=UPI0035C95DAD